MKQIHRRKGPNSVCLYIAGCHRIGDPKTDLAVQPNEPFGAKERAGLWFGISVNGNIIIH